MRAPAVAAERRMPVAKLAGLVALFAVAAILLLYVASRDPGARDGNPLGAVEVRVAQVDMREEAVLLREEDERDREVQETYREVEELYREAQESAREEKEEAREEREDVREEKARNATETETAFGDYSIAVADEDVENTSSIASDNSSRVMGNI